MAAGVLSTPEGLGATALRWHFVLWDPWWLVGGILFGLATWSYSRRSRGRALGVVACQAGGDGDS